MKIELSGSQVCTLAEHCANDIHGMVVSMHLRVVWGIWEDGSKPNPYVPWPGAKENLQAIRKAIRSIKNPWDRRQFVMHIKYYFQKLRTEKRTVVKWQDYVASVRAAKAEHDAKIAKCNEAIAQQPGVWMLERGIWTGPVRPAVPFADEFIPQPVKLQPEVRP